MLRLKELRNQRGLSILALAEKSGVSRRTIEDIEARGDCRISTAYLLCEALETTLNEFYKKEQPEK